MGKVVYSLALSCPQAGGGAGNFLFGVAPAGVSLLALQPLGLSEAVQRLSELVALISARGERN